MFTDQDPKERPHTQGEEIQSLDQFSKWLNVRAIKKGILIFLFITVVSLIGIFLYTNTGKTLEVISSIKWYWILLGFVFVFNDLVIGGLRNHIFIKEFKPGIPFMVSVRANLANIFMGAVTPSQSGGGPGQYYIYYRQGVSIPDNISNSLFNWISTIIFFPLSGAMAVYILSDKVPNGLVGHLTKFGFSVFTTLFFALLIGMLAPQVIGRMISMFGDIIKHIYSSLGEKISAFGVKAAATLTDYRDRYWSFIKKKPHLMVWSFILTIILYMNKYTLAYVILLAFGLEADFWTVIAIQAVLYLLLYFSPSPGGSGIAELSISGLMASIISNDYITSFTILYRGFLVFLPAILGAVVVLNQLSKEPEKA